MRNMLFVISVSLPLALGFSGHVLSHEKGDWIVRVGAAQVDPHESSSDISISGLGGDVAGTAVGVDGDSAAGINATYMLTDNWGVELLVATPFTHDVVAQGLQGAGLPSSFDLGAVRHLPPTLSVQYYFGSSNHRLRPYVSLGINYTLFFEERLSTFTEESLDANDLRLDDSVGLAGAIGADWMIDEHWLLNAAVYYMDIDTDARFNSAAVGRVEADVDIDPFTYVLGIGYRF